MCGRYALTLPPEALRALLAYIDQPNFPPRYNIAPTQPVPVVLLEEGRRRFRLMRWGFLPSWVKDPKEFPLVINIRSETAAEKPAFRNAFRRRRALMPADGFYEWHKAGKQSQPYLFRKPDRGAFAFAALWDTFGASDGSEIDTVALMNTHANRLMAQIHPRCPVIVEAKDYEQWLAPDAAANDLAPILQPPPEDFLETIAIGKAVNKVANDGPFVQEPAGEGKPVEEEKSIKEGGKPRRARPKAKADDQDSML